MHLCSLTSFYSGILLDILDLSHLSMSDYDRFTPIDFNNE